MNSSKIDLKSEPTEYIWIFCEFDRFAESSVYLTIMEGRLNRTAGTAIVVPPLLLIWQLILLPQ